MFGNCEIGRVVMASMPKKTIAIESEIASTGRWINLLNMVVGVGGELLGVQTVQIGQKRMEGLHAHCHVIAVLDLAQTFDQNAVFG